jgi:hypothetical protein
MRRPSFPVYISKRKEHSHIRFKLRVRKDTCLYNDAEDFIFKNPSNLNDLVNMLLYNRFSHARYTDPEYPM